MWIVSLVALSSRGRVRVHVPVPDGAALVSYGARLVPADARERLVQRREAIVAARVDGAAPCTNDDHAWQAAPWHELALAPLWWTEGAVKHAYVAALHDGETLALAVRWPDARPDVPWLDEQAALRIVPEAVPRWRDGEWTVLLHRALVGGPGGELELRPGESLWVSFAVWNGKARDLRAQKAITIWHALVLEE